MENFEKNTINGPINTVRLEGNIDNTKKVIYLFMDFHEPIERQYDCNNVLSLDIKDYLVKVLKDLKGAKSNKTYDFLLEIFPTTIYFEKHIMRKQRYINELSKFFSKLFSKDDKGRTIKPKHLPNIRLHYADPRGYFEGKKNIYNLSYYLLGYVHNMWETKLINANSLIEITNDVNIISNRIKFLNSLFLKQNKKPNITKKIIPDTDEEFHNLTEKEYDDISEYFVYKIKNEYTHNNIKKNINNIIKKYLYKTFIDYFAVEKKLFGIIKNIQSNIIKYTDLNKNGSYGTPTDEVIDMLSKLDKSINELFDKSTIVLVVIMDIYFLRRFLDKDYITNAIAYTGAAHSINYVYLLVKYFDFKITHYSYLSKSYDINKTHKFIKSIDDYKLLKKIFFPNVFSQCSDLTSFPPNFE